jgi:hypothetical protein
MAKIAPKLSEEIEFISPPVPRKLQQFATERLETPKDMLDRVLGREEKVIGSFEVYFQGNRLTRADYWYKVISTCGCYILNKWWEAFMMWFCCKTIDKINYKRGALVTTSSGRVIAWAHSYDQQAMDPKAEGDAARGHPYVIAHETKIFNAKDLRQMSLQVVSPELGNGIFDLFPCLINCCAVIFRFCGLSEFQAGITLCFHSFDDSLMASDPSGLVTVGSISSFSDLIKSFFGGMGHIRGPAGALVTTVTIISSNEDFVHNPNGTSNPKNIISDLHSLQKKLIDALVIQPSYQTETSSIAEADTFNGLFVDRSVVGSMLVNTKGMKKNLLYTDNL